MLAKRTSDRLILVHDKDANGREENERALGPGHVGGEVEEQCEYSTAQHESTYELADLDGERLEEARHGRLHLVRGHLRQLLGHVLQVLGHALLVDLHRVLRATDTCT